MFIAACHIVAKDFGPFPLKRDRFKMSTNVERGAQLKLTTSWIAGLRWNETRRHNYEAWKDPRTKGEGHK